jgi:hypothetical protein
MHLVGLVAGGEAGCLAHYPRVPWVSWTSGHQAARKPTYDTANRPVRSRLLVTLEPCDNRVQVFHSSPCLRILTGRELNRRAWLSVRLPRAFLLRPRR